MFILGLSIYTLLFLCYILCFYIVQLQALFFCFQLIIYFFPNLNYGSLNHPSLMLPNCSLTHLICGFTQMKNILSLLNCLITFLLLLHIIFSNMSYYLKGLETLLNITNGNFNEPLLICLQLHLFQ